MIKEKDLSQSFKDKFNKALSLKSSNNYQDALNLFGTLQLEEPEYYLTYTMIGHIYTKMNQLNEASENFKKAVSLNPNSEKVSLAYFHVLWDEGKEVEALDEMKRFLKNNDSETYQEILDEINEGE